MEIDQKRNFRCKRENWFWKKIWIFNIWLKSWLKHDSSFLEIFHFSQMDNNDCNFNILKGSQWIPNLITTDYLNILFRFINSRQTFRLTPGKQYVPLHWVHGFSLPLSSTLPHRFLRSSSLNQRTPSTHASLCNCFCCLSEFVNFCKAGSSETQKLCVKEN